MREAKRSILSLKDKLFVFGLIATVIVAIALMLIALTGAFT